MCYKTGQFYLLPTPKGLGLFAIVAVGLSLTAFPIGKFAR
jgi:hypothetical protein